MVDTKIDDTEISLDSYTMKDDQNLQSAKHQKIIGLDNEILGSSNFEDVRNGNRKHNKFHP